MSSVTFSTTVGGDGSTVTDDDNATTGLGNGGALIRLVPMMQQVVNVAEYTVNAADSVTGLNDLYLGSYSSNPTLNNSGDALITGNLYFNDVSDEMRVYTGSSWVAAYIPAGSYLALAGGTMTGEITFAAGQFGTNVNTFLSTPSSANLKAALTDETGSGAVVFATSPTLVTPALGTPTSGTLSSCTVDGTNGVGYINIPQNSQSAAYTLVAADAGKHIFHPSTDANARTFTIPANGSVAYPIGTAISFVNMTSQVVSIAITTDTMYLAGTGTTGTRSLAQYGTATALKMTSTTWIISGAGLT
jgi:hypothetical protein